MTDDQAIDQLLTAGERYDRSYHKGMRAAHEMIYAVPAPTEGATLDAIDLACGEWKAAARELLRARRLYLAHHHPYTDPHVCSQQDSTGTGTGTGTGTMSNELTIEAIHEYVRLLEALPPAAPARWYVTRDQYDTIAASGLYDMSEFVILGIAP